MANRSTLFATDHAPATLMGRGTFYEGVGEWEYHVPALALLLVSDAPKIGQSVLTTQQARDRDGGLHSMPNLYGQGRGKARAYKVLRGLQALNPSTTTEAMLHAVLTQLDQLKGPIFVLEVLDLLEMECSGPEAWPPAMQAWQTLAADMGAAVDALPDTPASAARELGAILDGQGEGPLAGLTLSDEQDSIERGEGALGLTGFHPTLFYDPQPRAPFLKDMSDRMHAKVVVPKVQSVLPPEARDWRYIVERTFFDVRDDGSYDRRYGFVLCHTQRTLMGLSKKYVVTPDPEVGDVRVTAARILEWSIETHPRVKAIAIGPQGVLRLEGEGHAEAAMQGSQRVMDFFARPGT